ncbi:Oxysterol-binding protein-domain-containing protein [Gongronella butleri]|nr:Oxysterol-binding protein-domain-containing protein [Gongronella butleri]
MPEIQIQARDAYEHHLYVKQPGATIHWSFSTKKNNISFGLFYSPGLPLTLGNADASSYAPSALSRQVSQRSTVAGTTTALDHAAAPRQHPQLELAQRRRKSSAVSHLLQRDFTEIIPVTHVQSSEKVIQGSHVVSEAGNFVLMFDNTSSIQKPKILSFTVSSDELIADERLLDDQIIAGYLLKKRRKRMQGWAKRWFELSPNGTLSYSVDPYGIKRGSIQVILTTMTIYPKQRTIHMDTGTTIYHLKALTKEDFEKWVEVLRRQRANRHQQHRRDSTGGILIDGTWFLPDNKYRNSTSSKTPTTLASSALHRSNFGEKSSDDDEDEAVGDNGCQGMRAGSVLSDKLMEDGTFVDASNSTTMDEGFLMMYKDLDTLKNDVRRLMRTWSDAAPVAPSTPTDAHFHPHQGAPTAQEQASVLATPATSPTSSLPSSPNSIGANNASSQRLKRRFTFRRGSQVPPLLPMDSLESGSLHQSILEQMQHTIQHMMDVRLNMEQEYVQLQRHVKSQQKRLSTIYQQRSEIGTPSSTSFYSLASSTSKSSAYADAQGDDEHVWSQDEDEDDLPQDELDDSSFDEVHQEEVASVQSNATIKPISNELMPLSTTRRKVLPHPMVENTVNLFELLRKNVGKDLSTISMPAALNEPLNLLQRQCEELEYSSLLDRADGLADPVDRLMYVAVFSVSAFASSQFRSHRKFFNPLLFETYECVRPDKGFKFIAEKVSHRPNIMACHAESTHFSFWQATEGTSKFWGRSMEFISEGTVHVRLAKSGDHFTYNKPSSHLRNMVFGTRYLEHIGDVKVQNESTGDYAMITYKEAKRGKWLSQEWDRNEVEIVCYQQNRVARRVVGKWSDELSLVLGERQYERLWKVQPPVAEDYEAYYGYTQFCMELNELTDIERDHLPPTDTRHRPDQRLLEQGCIDQAEDEKARVETLQRQRRAEYEANGVQPRPKWFESRPDDPLQWVYKGGYWEARAKQQWPADLEELW